MKTQIAAGVNLEYDLVGQGRGLVLLHAFPLDRRMWQAQQAAFHKEFRVLTPDFRGFGGSSSFTETPSLDQLADDVAALLDSLKITKPVVLGGLSMGGYVALAVARKFPTRLHALVLADTRAEADDATGKANRDKMIAFAKTHSALDVVNQMLPKLLGAETQAQRPGVAEEVRRLAAAQSSDGIIAALKVLRDRPDASPSLANIRIPTLVLVGDEDTLTPPTAAEKLAAGIPGAQLLRIPGAGHLSNLEQPELFNSAVLSFLNSLESAG